ncbi:MAG: JDVT-CTERM domain-containing protein, partial [Thiogranum sp.]
FNTGSTVPVVDTLAEIQGTSFTTAQVSAVAALMWAANGTELNPRLIQEILRSTTRVFPDSSCDTSICGSGILDADAALAAALDDPASVFAAAPANTSGGGGGCALVANGSSRFDPLFVLLLMAAGLRGCRRGRKSGFPE